MLEILGPSDDSSFQISTVFVDTFMSIVKQQIHVEFQTWEAKASNLSIESPLFEAIAHDDIEIEPFEMIFLMCKHVTSDFFLVEYLELQTIQKYLRSFLAFITQGTEVGQLIQVFHGLAEHALSCFL